MREYDDSSFCFVLVVYPAARFSASDLPPTAPIASLHPFPCSARDALHPFLSLLTVMALIARSGGSDCRDGVDVGWRGEGVHSAACNCLSHPRTHSCICLLQFFGGFRRAWFFPPFWFLRCIFFLLVAHFSSLPLLTAYERKSLAKIIDALARASARLPSLPPPHTGQYHFTGRGITCGASILIRRSIQVRVVCTPASHWGTSWALSSVCTGTAHLLHDVTRHACETRIRSVSLSLDYDD